MEDKKLRVAPAKQAPEAEATTAMPTAFLVPADVMNMIVQYIGQGSFFEVNELMTQITQRSKPVFPKTPANEAENTAAPVN